MERSMNNVAAHVSHQKAHTMAKSAKRGLLFVISTQTKQQIFCCITQHL